MARIGGREGHAQWWRAWFCEGCFVGGEDGVVVKGRERFEHERRWGRYEEGMRKGKEYKMERGRRLREERGIVEVEERKNGPMTLTVSGQGLSLRYCPIMEEFRFCLCDRGYTPHV